jgi:hypothetical protein
VRGDASCCMNRPHKSRNEVKLWAVITLLRELKVITVGNRLVTVKETESLFVFQEIIEWEKKRWWINC